MTDTLNPRRRPDTRPRRLAIAVAILLALAVALAVPRPADGGTYQMAQCHPGLGALHADTSFSRTSNHYRGDAGCDDDGGDGLSVRHDGESTQEGKLGAWTLDAPAGAAIVGLRTSVAGTAKGGHTPELVVGRSGTSEPVGRAAGDRHWEDWTGEPASWLAARLRCVNGSCGPGREALIAIKRLAVTLRDVAAPALDPLGSLFDAGTRRGAQSAGASVTDRGSGVHRLRVEVNDTVVATRTLGCQLSGQTALRTVPCPTDADVELELDTSRAPFRQGRNDVRVCGLDLAPAGGANRTCADRHVRVDNACPLGGEPLADTLESEVRRRRSGARVRGRLLDSAGDPVGGARACVASRIALAGVGERIVATPTTGTDGRFSAELPPGPSRQVRVAYWPSPDRALERFDRLDVPARPRLALRPRGQLRNGERVGFRVRLPGPGAERRAVAIQVRADGRWLDLRTGRTDRRGRYASGYRFRSTTGTQAYRFRALVPKQMGYPYERGRSKARRVTVVG